MSDWEVLETKEGQAAYSESHYFNEKQVDVDRFRYILLLNKISRVKLPIYAYWPKDKTSCKRIIFSIHGTYRNANKYRNIFVGKLQNDNALLIAPQFDDASFASSLAFNIGNVKNFVSQADFNPKSQWTFGYIDQLYEVFLNNIPSLESFSLFGHSAGAQFVHRYVIFSDNPCLDVAIAVNAGWLTFMDFSEEFPYGVKNILNEEKVKRIFKKKLVLMAGENDIKQDKKLRITPRSCRQGDNRLERSSNAFLVAKKLAHKLNAEFCWEFKPVKGLEHSAADSVFQAEEYLLGH